MKKIYIKRLYAGILLLCLIVALPLTFGCKNAAQGDYFAYARGAASMKIEGRVNGTAFSASVFAGAMTDETDGEDGELFRVLEVTYSAPTTVCGMKISRGADGRVYLLLADGKNLLSPLDITETAGELSAPAELVFRSGEVLSVSTGVYGGKPVTHIRHRADGASGETVTTIDNGTGFPLRVESGDIVAVITEFIPERD